MECSGASAGDQLLGSGRDNWLPDDVSKENGGTGPSCSGLLQDNTEWVNMPFVFNPAVIRVGG